MNRIAPFKLERYFAKYEFSTRYLLSPSDCQSLSLQDILQMADPVEKQLWESLSLGYTESLGHPLLRERISTLYKSIVPDQVMVAAPEEGIFIAMNTILQPGDHVVAISPAYQSLHSVAQSLGCKLTLWRVELQDDHWVIDLDKLEKSITPQTRLLVVNFPHNPTGFLPSHKEFNRLIELAHRHDLFLFSDEMYRFLEHDPRDRLPSVCEVYKKGITMSGMSKTFAMPGARIGWLITQDVDLYRRWVVFKDYTTICSSAPSEILSIITLRNYVNVAERSRNIVNNNLGIAKKFFDQYPEIFQWIPPNAGSIAFPRLVLDTPADEFCLDLVQKKNVMITPASLFDFPGNHIRIGLGRTNFSEGLKFVEEYIQQL